MMEEKTEDSRESALFEAILQLKTVEECKRFFYDLCTPAEAEEFGNRWHVARLLVKDMPYRQIADEAGVSTTTVGRVARFLNHGHQGYKTVLKRLGEL